MLTIGGRYGWKGYKNCGVVFKAFRKFLSRIPNDKTSKIICISHSNTPESQIQNLIKDLPVYFTGATDSELAMIREKTHCLLYPSAIEGFGLPILEAIYSGMNVIASDILPHREATGTFASQVQFVPPFDEDLYADAMYQFFCQRVSDANKLKNHASLQAKICRLSEERWMSFADALSSFALRPGSLRVKNAVYQNDLWLTAMEASFHHKKQSLPLRIASSWNRDRI
jgi:glycosyltransferase involved in cell wall biosynthesis